MAINFDSSAQQVSGNWTHTCTGSDGILFVWTNERAGTTTGVTYNGVAMTSTPSGIASFKIWYLLSPATGANTVATTGTTVGAISTSYTGVKQTGFPDSNGSNSDAVLTSIICTTTVVTSDCWIVGFGNSSRTSGSSSSITTSRTLRETYTNAALGIHNCAVVIWDSNGIVATGSQSQTTTTNSGGTGYSIANAIISIAPATAPTTSSNMLLVL